MKTSLNTAAIRCAVIGRNAERTGKYAMDSLARMSYLSVLHQSAPGSIPAGFPCLHAFTGLGLHDVAMYQGQPAQAMQMPSNWRHDSDSRIPGKRNLGNVMRIQETLPSQSLAVA